MAHKRRAPPPGGDQDLIDVVERVLRGGVLVEGLEDGEPRPASGPDETPWISIPLGPIDVLTLHTGHSIHPAARPRKPTARR